MVTPTSEQPDPQGIDADKDEPDTDWLPPAEGETRDEGDAWTPLPIPEADDGDL